MSDDDYTDDEYWYEEEEYMGLGDELAENAVCSPIMVEDPSLATVEDFSDWEYYSDDYYDDDPIIIREQHTVSGELEAHGPRKKKRKLSALEEKDIPDLSLGPAIVDTDSSTFTNFFRGVVWKPHTIDQETTLYEPGKGEKVAFLSDWREVFKTSLYRTDWPQKNGVHEEEEKKKKNGLSEDKNQRGRGIFLDSTPERQENGAISGDDRYGGTYSPPPLAIEDMNKSINRQKDKLIRHNLEKPQSNLREVMVVEDSEEEEPDGVEPDLEKPQSHLREMMVIEDSEEELDDEPAQTPSKTTEMENSTNMNQEQTREKDEAISYRKLLRVEVPALSNVKTKSFPSSTSQRKRGRNPKDSPVSETTNTKPSKKARTSQQKALPHPPTKEPFNGRELVNSKTRKAEVDVNDEIDGKRRSKRIASSSSSAAAAAKEENQPEPKRIRTTSPGSTKGKRGRKKKV